LGCWLCAIAVLAVITPGSEPHYSLCLFKLAGIHFCPGCGLGHSISYLLHGDIKASFLSHPLGLFALIIIAGRTYKLVQVNLLAQKVK